jgi:hypothetical protein
MGVGVRVRGRGDKDKERQGFVPEGKFGEERWMDGVCPSYGLLTMRHAVGYRFSGVARCGFGYWLNGLVDCRLLTPLMSCLLHANIRMLVQSLCDLPSR